MSQRSYHSFAIESRLNALGLELKPGGKRPKCYVSGPMTGLPFFNFSAFEQATIMLREAYWFVYSPRENDLEKGMEPDPEGKTISGEYQFKDLMKTDLWQVCDSDAVFVLPGWEYSQGALIEVDVAHRVGVPVYSLLSCRQLPAPPIDRHEFSSGRMSQIPGVTYVDKDERRPHAVISNVTDAPLSSVNFGPSWRATHEPTGGQKGRKQAVFATIPVHALVQEARVHGWAVQKYPDIDFGKPNWRLGMPWSWFFDALMRHLLEFWAGKSKDDETGLHPLAHVRWMAAALMEFDRLGIGVDDRIEQLGEEEAA